MPFSVCLLLPPFYYWQRVFAGILDQKSDSVKFARTRRSCKEYQLPENIWLREPVSLTWYAAAQIFALYYGLSTEKENSIKSLMDEFTRHNCTYQLAYFLPK
jgi:hypothetical protein